MNISTLRGMRLRNAVFEYPQIVPYRMLPNEQGHSPGELLVKAIETVIPNATKLTPQQWEEVKQTTKWNGDYLYNWGLWNVLLSRNTTRRGNRRCCRARPMPCSMTAAATSRWWTTGTARRRSNISSSTFRKTRSIAG